MDIETPAASVNDPWWRLHNSTIALLAVALGSAILVLMYVPNAFYVTGICSLIWLLKNNHGREVYLLFYTFFGIASISFLIALYLQSAGIVDIKHFDLHDLSGLDHGNKLVASIRWLIHVTTDAAGEFEFVGVILALAFIPQILSYIFSGPFGCGRPPAFVKTLTHAALISFMKFFCCYAGINLGVAFCFFVDVIHAPQLYSSVAEKAGRSIQPLFLAFLLAGINAGLWPLVRLVTFLVKAKIERVSLILGFMVRHAEVELALQPYERRLVGGGGKAWHDLIEKATLGLSGRYQDLKNRDNPQPLVDISTGNVDVERLVGVVMERVSAQLGLTDDLRVDHIARRIAWLIEHCLTKVASNEASSETLYVDPKDKRLWERTVLAMHWRAGYHAVMLAVISPEKAKQKYGYVLGGLQKTCETSSAAGYEVAV